VKRATRRLLVVLVCAGSAFSTTNAHADAEADAQIAKGIELREKGRDDEALALFRKALARTPSARARAQVGLAEQALGMWVLAETDLAEALGEGDAWITKNRAALEGALAVVRKRLATLEVRGAANGEVLIDGVKIGSGAGPFRVEAGKRSLEVRAPGFHSTTRTVELPPGGIARETVTLVAETSPSSASAAPLADKPGGTTAADPGRGQRVLGWAFVGTGAALLVTGAVGLVVRKGIIDDYNASPCPGLGVAQPASCDDQVSSASTWLTISILSFIGGGLLGAGGGVLVVTAPSAPESSAKRHETRFACAPSARGDGATIGCGGVF
jgi:hypothetical protein